MTYRAAHRADYHRSHPDFGELPVVLPEGFEDVSWHDDYCPSFIHEGKRVILYVDYLDRSKRCDGQHPDAPRFTLCRTDEHGEVLWDDSVLHTDDWSAVVALVAELRG